MNRKLHENTPREKYRRRKNEDKSTFHFGQRKLLLSEIEFLTLSFIELIERKDNDKIIFIYAGAAPGIHLPFLMNIFPFIYKYIFIDPAKFNFDKSSIDKNIKYETINECFTDKMAEKMRKQYSDYEILFVSDIRTANYRILSRNITELKVEQDMVDQMGWYKILKPFKSMLKFRLPYVGNDKQAKTKIDYLDGDVYFQAWEGKTSSETRLIVNNNAGIRTYDCVEYEDMLFRFNTVERVLGYKHDVKAPGIDHCYDCRTEVFIIEEYLKLRPKLIEKMKFPKTDLFLKNTIADFIYEINKNLRADKKKDELTVSLKGQQIWYSVCFTNIFFGANLEELFNRDCITIPNNKNSSDDEFLDDEKEKFQVQQSMIKSPHTLQNSKFLEIINEEDFQTRRILNDDFPQMNRSKFEPKSCTTVFFKERSLRLCEIEFLTKSCVDLIQKKNFNKKIVCFYAGSAASKRLDHLFNMFPFIKFLLFDPKKFDIEPNNMIVIKQEYLTEDIALDLALEYNEWTKIFISNIKRAKDNNLVQKSRFDKDDLSLQTSIHYILKPFKSMLRFTFPTTKGTGFDYFDGEILFKPWSHKSSIESVIIVDQNYIPKNYNFQKYRNQFYRFNNFERVLTYNHQVRASGIDLCYDCRCEVDEKYPECGGRAYSNLVVPNLNLTKPHNMSHKFRPELKEVLKARINSKL
ncbi:unnamed protein product [Brachionus calyciflorus]|uniref:Cap-specific mRNA (nucleoside-2'-O-)-methyltransferase n=1 Tax=Brachionus calyciflorus TaxID=104777 RepID=A0A814IT57_9BILA|nr:unnamed protein product [Brachionus calyciflorus]